MDSQTVAPAEAEAAPPQTAPEQAAPPPYAAPPAAAQPAPAPVDEVPVGATLQSNVQLVLEKTTDGALLRIAGHDQALAEFHGPQAVGLARQALADVQRAIIKYAYQTAFVYMEMMARQHERARLEAALRTIDPSLTQLQQELRALTEY